MSAKIFTKKQKQEIEMILALAWSGRGKEVEDVSKEINENMFPLSEQQIKDVDKAVETLIYGGTISGSSTQVIYYDDDGSSVIANPNPGYYFSGWTDGNKETSRTDRDIRANLSVTANFIHNPSSSFVPPSTPKVSIEPYFSNGVIDWSVANVYQMAISESGDFSKSSWVPYETSYKNFNKTLYIKFRSPDGGESKIYTISPEINVPVIDKPEVAFAPVVSVKPIAVIEKTFKFKNDLKLGMDNADVKELQKFLNSNGFLVAAGGIGSLGQESTYFGRMTRAALIKFQKANNIYPALGFFGPITRKVVAEKTNK